MDDQARISGLTDRVRKDIYQHVFGNPDREVGGVLVGVHIDSGVSVRGMIPALEAVGERAAVTFTHDAWEIVHRELDRRFPDQQIVGWYHSHPGFGIFLSRDDLFIHESFFSEPWQFAYVIDPIGLEEGEFCWREGGVVEAGRRAISPPPGFTPPPRTPVTPGGSPRGPRPTYGDDAAVRLHPHRREFPLGGALASLAIGALAGFLVAPTLGVGDSGGAPKHTSQFHKTRSRIDEIASTPATRKPAARSRRRVAPPPAPPTTAPAVKSYPSKAAPVEKERYAPKPEYDTGAEAPAEGAADAGTGGGVEAQAGGTEVPPGHFNDE
jgi:proteasome lid subunit RPN8/RPN11